MKKPDKDNANTENDSRLLVQKIEEALIVLDLPGSKKFDCHADYLIYLDNNGDHNKSLELMIDKIVSDNPLIALNEKAIDKAKSIVMG